MSIAGVLNMDPTFQVGVEALIRSIVGEEKVGIILVLVDSQNNMEMATNFHDFDAMANYLDRAAIEAKKGPDRTIMGVRPS